MSSASPPRRGSYAPSERRRREISAAVLGIIDELGHEGLTTSLTAERAGASEATVLYHYPTKDHLLVAALAEVDRTNAEIYSLAEGTPDLDLAQLRVVPEVDNRTRLLVMLRGQVSTNGHPAQQYFRDRWNEAVAVFTRMIERRQVEGTAHSGIDAGMAARQFYAMWEGLLVMRQVNPEFDAGEAAYQGFRRITGANVLDIAGAVRRGSVGL